MAYGASIRTCSGQWSSLCRFYQTLATFYLLLIAVQLCQAADSLSESNAIRNVPSSDSMHDNPSRIVDIIREVSPVSWLIHSILVCRCRSRRWGALQRFHCKEQTCSSEGRLECFECTKRSSDKITSWSDESGELTVPCRRGSEQFLERPSQDYSVWVSNFERGQHCWLSKTFSSTLCVALDQSINDD